MVPKYKVRTIICKNCGKKSTKRRPDGQKYCSLECYRNGPRPQRKTGKTTKCGTCHKEIYVRLSELKDTNFCSVECFNVFQSSKVSYTCKICGKIFEWSPSREHNLGRVPKYCSIECRNACGEWKQSAVIAGNLIQCNAKGLNKLELAGNEILDALGIEYQTQVLVCNKFCVDVFIESSNLVIQWDGDYWHGYKGVKDARQQKRCLLDKSQDAYLLKAGYKVLRFWEHEVYKEQEKVYEDIKATI